VSRHDVDRLADITSAIEAIQSHLTKGDLHDGLGLLAAPGPAGAVAVDTLMLWHIACGPWPAPTCAS
jgi:hypothetical protein